MTDIVNPTPSEVALFCEFYHRNGGDPVDAAVKARIVNPMYSIDTIATRLMERGDVKAGLAAIKKVLPNPINAEITRESIVSDMQQVYERALGAGDTKGAIAAKRLQAELKKLLSAEVNINLRKDPSLMSDAELMEIVKGRAIEAEYTDVTPETKQGIAVISN